MLHTNDQPNIPSGSGERVCFVGFAIFSYGSQLGFLIGLHLTTANSHLDYSMALQSGHAACEI